MAISQTLGVSGSDLGSRAHRDCFWFKSYQWQSDGHQPDTWCFRFRSREQGTQGLLLIQVIPVSLMAISQTLGVSGSDLGSRAHRDCFWFKSYQWQSDHHWPDTWCFRFRSRACLGGVSVLWLDEKASLIHIFCFRVTACRIVPTHLFLGYTVHVRKTSSSQQTDN